VIEEWPSRSWMALGCAPSAMHSEAQVSEIVKPHRHRQSGSRQGRLEDRSVERSVPDDVAVLVGENEVVGCGDPVGEMCPEFVPEEGGQGDGSVFVRLGFAENEAMAFYLGDGFGDKHPASEEVEAADAEGANLAGAQAGVGSKQNKRLVMGVDGRGEGFDLLGGEKRHFGLSERRGLGSRCTGWRGWPRSPRRWRARAAGPCGRRGSCRGRSRRRPCRPRTAGRQPASMNRKGHCAQIKTATTPGSPDTVHNSTGSTRSNASNGSMGRKR
jgi:hypothetical protein